MFAITAPNNNTTVDFTSKTAGIEALSARAIVSVGFTGGVKNLSYMCISAVVSFQR